METERTVQGVADQLPTLAAMFNDRLIGGRGLKKMAVRRSKKKTDDVEDECTMFSCAVSCAMDLARPT